MHNQITQEWSPDLYFPVTQSPPLTWIEIDKKAFDHNVQQYKKKVSPSLFAVVVKSNAYGHGTQQIAMLAQKNPHVDYLCTVSLSEALALRKMGITKPLLVLSILDNDLEEAFNYDIELVVYDKAQALLLNTIGIKFQQKIKIHIKVDTGLSRLGVNFLNAPEFVQELSQLPYLTLQGIFTHFVESEKLDQSFTNLQIDRFNELLSQLEQRTLIIPLKHASCSAALTSNVRSHFNMTRAGIGIYGLWPSSDTKKIAQEADSRFTLKPVLRWKTKIIQIKEVQAGSFIGYNRTHYVAHNAKIATLPVGYWDGYDRKLSNKGFVLINNQRAPLVGTIAMNLMMVDVTGLQVTLDDEVILLDASLGLSAESLAQLSGTIHYEFVTRINPILPRRVCD